MSDSVIQRIKELEEELENLKSQLKEKGDDEKDAMSCTSPQINTDSKSDGNVRVSRKERKGGKDRPFDFSAHPRRHVALRLAYLGWGYQGFAVQENTENTVEARLFEALLKTRLIQDRQSSNYHRCGRTDKGVSAFSQVRLLVFSGELTGDISISVLHAPPLSVGVLSVALSIFSSNGSI